VYEKEHSLRKHFENTYIIKKWKPDGILIKMALLPHRKQNSIKNMIIDITKRDEID
jgi:hypothetical protein